MTALAQPLSSGPSWEDQIVPTLRKRECWGCPSTKHLAIPPFLDVDFALVCLTVRCLNEEQMD